MSAETIYEIFALKTLGPMDLKLAKALYHQGWDVDYQVQQYIWAVRDKQTGEVTLVDTASDDVCVARFKSLNKRATSEQPAPLVARLGIKPEQVTKVVITHMHIDHHGGMLEFPTLYPKAQFYVQKKEFEFWAYSPIAQRAPYKMFGYAPATEAMVQLSKTPRLCVVDGDQIIGPGMKLLLCPGHTPGLQAVLVNTAKGPTILASDASHTFRGLQDDLPSGILSDITAWLQSYDKMKALAPLENIFPGHDILIETNYPKVAEGITQLA